MVNTAITYSLSFDENVVRCVVVNARVHQIDFKCFFFLTEIKIGVEKFCTFLTFFNNIWEPYM